MPTDVSIISSALPCSLLRIYAGRENGSSFEFSRGKRSPCSTGRRKNNRGQVTFTRRPSSKRCLISGGAERVFSSSRADFSRSAATVSINSPTASSSPPSPLTLLPPPPPVRFFRPERPPAVAAAAAESMSAVTAAAVPAAFAEGRISCRWTARSAAASSSTCCRTRSASLPLKRTSHRRKKRSRRTNRSRVTTLTSLT